MLRSPAWSGWSRIRTPTLATPPFPIHMQGPEKIEGALRAAGGVSLLHFSDESDETADSDRAAGFTADGLPVGLPIVGRHLDDPLAPQAAAFEAAAPLWRDQWPPLLAKLGL